mgnify:CR=1 FL=1
MLQPDRRQFLSGATHLKRRNDELFLHHWETRYCHDNVKGHDKCHDLHYFETTVLIESLLINGGQDYFGIYAGPSKLGSEHDRVGHDIVNDPGDTMTVSCNSRQGIFTYQSISASGKADLMPDISRDLVRPQAAKGVVYGDALAESLVDALRLAEDSPRTEDALALLREKARQMHEEKEARVGALMDASEAFLPDAQLGVSWNWTNRLR